MLVRTAWELIFHYRKNIIIIAAGFTGFSVKASGYEWMFILNQQMCSSHLESARKKKGEKIEKEKKDEENQTHKGIF